jgi:hypothetical protein
MVILGTRSRDHQPRGAVVLRRTLRVRKGSINGRVEAPAEEADGCLLRSGKSKRIGLASHRSSHQAAVITPGPRNPRAGLSLLIPQLGCLLEGLVVVDAENRAFGANISVKDQATRLRRKVPRPSMTHGSDPLEPVQSGSPIRTATPSNFDLFQAIGKAIGVLNNTPNSYAMLVYFQK